MKRFGYFETEKSIIIYRCLPVDDLDRLGRLVETVREKLDDRKLYVHAPGPYVNRQKVLEDIGVEFDEKHRPDLITKHFRYLLEHSENPEIDNKDFPIIDFGRGLFVNWEEAVKLGCEPYSEDLCFIKYYFESVKSEAELYESRCVVCNRYRAEHFAICPFCRHCQRCQKPNIESICWYCHNGIERNRLPIKKANEFTEVTRENSPGQYFVR